MENHTGHGLSVGGGVSTWHGNGGLTNPSVWRLNETDNTDDRIVLAYSEGCMNCTIDAGHKHIGVGLGTFDGPAPNFQDLTPLNPIFPWATEDPSIFCDSDSGFWHILAHRTSSTQGGGPTGDAVASHAVAPSPHGPWKLASVPPYGRDIRWEDGSTSHVQKRERPQIIIDRKFKIVALSNGVRPGNTATPISPGLTADWTYTHVQLVDRSAIKSDDVHQTLPTVIKKRRLVGVIQTVPSVAFAATHPENITALPFDGVMLIADPPVPPIASRFHPSEHSADFSFATMSNRSMNSTALIEQLGQLKGVDLGNVTENFLLGAQMGEPTVIL
eukprot:COSAG01_NODE_5121_length_4471_cov_8.084629_7_plen_330_part_00